VDFAIVMFCADNELKIQTLKGSFFILFFCMKIITKTHLLSLV
jgi:hypothetical protein